MSVLILKEQLLRGTLMNEENTWEQTLEALEDVERGECVSENEVYAWLKTWGTEHVSEPPRPSSGPR